MRHLFVQKDEPKEFWITNMSKTDVMLGDLGFSIKAYRSANLLDKKHFHFTWEQIRKSAISGSIFRKKSKIAIRKKSPNDKVNKISVDMKTFQQTRSKSIFEIKKETFAELDLTDEEFAEENSE